MRVALESKVLVFKKSIQVLSVLPKANMNSSVYFIRIFVYNLALRIFFS